METNDERREKIVAFAKLEPEKQLNEVEKLEAGIKAIEDEEVSKRKEVEVCQNKLKRLEQEVSSAKSQYSDARAKRQNLFALGMETKELDAEIWKLNLDLEAREALRADAIAGLGSRVSDLSKELAFLEEEKNGLKKTILEFKQVPLIPKFNREIAQAMRTFEQIYEGQELLDYGFQHSRTGGFRMIQLSGWEWLEHVGKVYLVGDIPDEDQLSFGRSRWTWHFREYIEGRRKEREKTAS